MKLTTVQKHTILGFVGNQKQEEHFVSGLEFMFNGMSRDLTLETIRDEAWKECKDAFIEFEKFYEAEPNTLRFYAHDSYSEMILARVEKFLRIGSVSE